MGQDSLCDIDRYYCRACRCPCLIRSNLEPANCCTDRLVDGSDRASGRSTVLLGVRPHRLGHRGFLGSPRHPWIVLALFNSSQVARAASESSHLAAPLARGCAGNWRVLRPHSGYAGLVFRAALVAPDRRLPWPASTGQARCRSRIRFHREDHFRWA